MRTKGLVLFIDSGDTLVDESKQVWAPDQKEVVLEAGLIEGAEEALRLIKKQGYLVSLVADGRDISFQNVYTRQYGLRSCFDAWIVSETIGVSKPAAQMFQAAMDALGLGPADKSGIIMVGNNLGRDVLGANLFGITSVWIDWSPRYRLKPENKDEIPDYIIHTPSELPPLMEELELKLHYKDANGA